MAKQIKKKSVQKIKEQQIEKPVALIPDGLVIIIATENAISMKKGKEYEVHSEHAKTLIKKGFAQLKNV
jgi:hypothetical protein